MPLDRRTEGKSAVNDYGGIINVFKPVGMTSFAVVSRMRRLTGIKKIGHCGTLDPFAEGVLPVCIGRATAAVQFMDSYDKSYRVEMIFGAETDTQDCTGTRICENMPTEQQRTDMEKSGFPLLKEAVSALTGTQEQLPPMYSAIKIKGRPLYEYARQGIEIERKKRTITIYDAQIVEASAKEDFRATLDIHCSKGTYIRTVCMDLGRSLSFGAYANTLRRTACGPFTLANGHTLEQIEEMLVDRTQSPLECLIEKKCCIPVEFALSHMRKIILSREQTLKLIQGQIIHIKDTVPLEEPLLAFCEPDRFIGVAEVRGIEGQEVLISAERIFVDVAEYQGNPKE